jgi:hypothetical protein
LSLLRQAHTPDHSGARGRNLGSCGTKLKGKSLVTARTVASKDGKSQATTFTGVNAQGQKVINVVVEEKQ